MADVPIALHTRKEPGSGRKEWQAHTDAGGRAAIGPLDPYACFESEALREFWIAVDAPLAKPIRESITLAEPPANDDDDWFRFGPDTMSSADSLRLPRLAGIVLERQHSVELPIRCLGRTQLELILGEKSLGGYSGTTITCDPRFIDVERTNQVFHVKVARDVIEELLKPPTPGSAPITGAGGPPGPRMGTLGQQRRQPWRRRGTLSGAGSAAQPARFSIDPSTDGSRLLVRS